MTMQEVDRWLAQTRTTKDIEYDEAIRASQIVQDVFDHDSEESL